MPRKPTRKARILSNVGKELRDNPPAAVESARREGGAKKAETVRRAILLSKARRRGARIPKAT